MPRFKFTAVGPDGATITGVEEGYTPSSIRRALASRDLEPIEVTEQKSIWTFEITRSKVKRKDLMRFSRQMSIFLRAGLPVLTAMDAMMEEAGSKALSKVIAEMSDSLREGETFAGAAAAHPEAFPPFYLSVLQSAELTGNLDGVLGQLAEYLDRDLEARRRITSALVYPALVLVLAIVAVVILTTYVLPRFETFFSSLHANLPLPTRALIDVTRFLRNWWFIFVFLAAAIIIAVVVLTQTTRGREVRDGLVLRLPVLGEVVRFAVLERFCRVLSSMVLSGVPLPDALVVTSAATNNAVYRRGLTQARAAMMRGEGFARPISETGLFPVAARQMLRVGEDTGTLDEQLESAAMYFDRELDYKLKRFTSLFEPAVIIAMGLLVGFVAIALVSAMYGIYRQVNIA